MLNQGLVLALTLRVFIRSIESIVETILSWNHCKQLLHWCNFKELLNEVDFYWV